MALERAAGDWLIAAERGVRPAAQRPGIRHRWPAL